MAVFTVPLAIAVMAHPKVRAANGERTGLAVFGPDLSHILWANTAGAALFSLPAAGLQSGDPAKSSDGTAVRQVRASRHMLTARGTATALVRPEGQGLKPALAAVIENIEGGNIIGPAVLVTIALDKHQDGDPFCETELDRLLNEAGQDDATLRSTDGTRLGNAVEESDGLTAAPSIFSAFNASASSVGIFEGEEDTRFGLADLGHGRILHWVERFLEPSTNASAPLADVTAAEGSTRETAGPRPVAKPDEAPAEEPADAATKQPPPKAGLGALVERWHFRHTGADAKAPSFREDDPGGTPSTGGSANANVAPDGTDGGRASAFAKKSGNARRETIEPAGPHPETVGPETGAPKSSQEDGATALETSHLNETLSAPLSPGGTEPVLVDRFATIPVADTDEDAFIPPDENRRDRDDRALSSATGKETDAAFEPVFDRPSVRFVWRIDNDGRFRSISPEFAAAVGPRLADILGQRFRDVAEALGIDRDGTIARLLDKRDTWSGRTVEWPVENSTARVPVDLAALPVYARDRSFDGFRGFGVVRLAEAVAAPVPMPMQADPTPSSDGIDATTVTATEDESALMGTETLYAGESGARGLLQRISALDTDKPFGRRGAAERPRPPESQEPQKVIRLEERRRSQEANLSSAEEAAFRAIGEELGDRSEAGGEGRRPEGAGTGGSRRQRRRSDEPA